jgi:ribosome-binding protein aMBF1 (putative translation factor)
MIKKAREYSSPILESILSEIDPKEQIKCDKRMMLAIKIEEAMLAKGWKKGDLAREMNKQPSIITRWLSGTNNFESDTLFELEEKLGINLINVQEKQREQILHFHLNLTQKIKTDNSINIINEPGPNYPKAVWTFNNQGGC